MFGARKRNQEVETAFQQLQKSRMLVMSVGMNFPDVKMMDLQVEKHKWTVIPEPFAKGVMTLGTHIELLEMSVLTHYEPNGVIEPHKHDELIEVVYVLQGEVKELISGKVCKKGDMLLIPKGKPHHIVENGKGEAYLWIAFSRHTKKLHPDKNWKEYRLEKVH